VVMSHDESPGSTEQSYLCDLLLYIGPITIAANIGIIGRPTYTTVTIGM